MRQFYIIGSNDRYLDGGGGNDNVYSTRFLDSNAQRWELETISGDPDWFKLKCVANNKYLDGISPNDGNTNVEVKTDLGSDNQKWKLIYTGNEALFYLQNKAGLRYIDFGETDSDVKVKIDLSSTLGKSQQVIFLPVDFR
jgi:hypothetical protein